MKSSSVSRQRAGRAPPVPRETDLARAEANRGSQRDRERTTDARRSESQTDIAYQPPASPVAIARIRPRIARCATAPARDHPWPAWGLLAFEGATVPYDADALVFVDKREAPNQADEQRVPLTGRARPLCCPVSRLDGRCRCAGVYGPSERTGGGKSGLHGGRVAANGRRGRPQGKCHRKQTASRGFGRTRQG